jgi:hypothetical protein
MGSAHGPIGNGKGIWSQKMRQLRHIRSSRITINTNNNCKRCTISIKDAITEKT